MENGKLEYLVCGEFGLKAWRVGESSACGCGNVDCAILALTHRILGSPTNKVHDMTFSEDGLRWSAESRNFNGAKCGVAPFEGARFHTLVRFMFHNSESLKCII